MEIIDLSKQAEDKVKTGVALGNFDGVHLGHRALIKTNVEISKEMGLAPSVLLFTNHTKTILGNKPDILTDNTQKMEILKDLKVERVYTIAFDEELMSLSPDEFVKTILVEKLNCKLVVVGFNYRFGHKASGNAKILKELGLKYGIKVVVVEAVVDEGDIMSSTRIRGLLKEGNIKMVNRSLGRNYLVKGKVIHGKNRGNKLGFPTANIEVDENLIPKEGVYATNTIIGGKSYLSATNIGYNPTFGDGVLKVETHILDFDGNLYDTDIEIEFLDYIRGDIKFDNKDDLIRQMEDDVKAIKSVY